MALSIEKLEDFPDGRSYVILEATATPGQFRVTTFDDDAEYLRVLAERVAERGKTFVKGLTIAATVQV
jgi:hypothetical protein